MFNTKRILVYDTDRESRRAIREHLEKTGFEVLDTSDCREAIEWCIQEPFYLAVVELNPNDLDGLEISIRVKSSSQFVPVLFTSGVTYPPVSFADYQSSADGHLHKPVDLKELDLHVDALIRARTSFDRLLEAQSEQPLLLVTDSLTGLYNRQFLSMRLEEEMNRASRYGYPLSLLVIDLDDFKEINHRHGFQAGDGILRGIAELLRTSLRQVDTVCRYGGEEFVALLPHTDCAGAVIAAERLRRTVEKQGVAVPPAGVQTSPDTAVDTTVHLTVSIGIAVHPDCETTPDGLVQLADQAMTVAKRKGKNCVILGGR